METMINTGEKCQDINDKNWRKMPRYPNRWWFDGDAANAAMPKIDATMPKINATWEKWRETPRYSNTLLNLLIHRRLLIILSHRPIAHDPDCSWLPTGCPASVADHWWLPTGHLLLLLYLHLHRFLRHLQHLCQLWRRLPSKKRTKEQNYK